MQCGPPVAARGGLPVPLLGLHGRGGRCPVVTGPAPPRRAGPASGPAGKRPPGALGRPRPHPPLGAGVVAAGAPAGRRARRRPAHGPARRTDTASTRRRARPRARGSAAPARGRPRRTRRRRRSATIRRPRRRIRAGAAERPGCWRRPGHRPRWRRTQMGLGTVEVAAAQQHRAEDAHRLDLAGLDGEPQAHFLGSLVGDLLGLVRGFLLTGRLRKTPCPEQICHVPHNVHRRTTCNLGTSGIPQPLRSLQRFVDMPTGRQVKHRSPQLPWRRGRSPHRHMRSHIHEGPDPSESGPSWSFARSSRLQ